MSALVAALLTTAAPAAADAVVGASLFSQMGDVDLLPAWAGALVLLGYAAALTLAGRLTTFARDVV